MNLKIISKIDYPLFVSSLNDSKISALYIMRYFTK